MNTIKINRETLLAPLYAVSGIIERRHTLPVLDEGKLVGVVGKEDILRTLVGRDD